MIPYQNPSIPSLVRIKPGALDRTGIYLSRDEIRSIVLLYSEGLPLEILQRAEASCKAHGVTILSSRSITDASMEAAAAYLGEFPSGAGAVVGLGGGKALDFAKFVSHLAQRPFYTIPTSLSNDGFCSPQSSLTVAGKRRSLGAQIPSGVIIDTTVCLNAPEMLWWSGVGDLVAKITAVHDWRLAFHADGTPFNDFAALLSVSTVHQFVHHPHRDEEGVRLLATALMLSGVAMEICGNSRPASGSEHLVSHAHDLYSRKPMLHGLQVGVATYIISILQGSGNELIAKILDTTNFWAAFENQPLKKDEWLAAFRKAPLIKPGYHTVLSVTDRIVDVASLMETDERLKRLFTKQQTR